MRNARPRVGPFQRRLLAYLVEAGVTVEAPQAPREIAAALAWTPGVLRDVAESLGRRRWIGGTEFFLFRAGRDQLWITDEGIDAQRLW